MSEPFFDYIARYRHLVSKNMYGNDKGEQVHRELDYTPLPETELTADLVKTLQSRKSTRNFANTPVTLETLATILRFSIAHDANSVSDTHRLFPSGSKCFAIETYLTVDRVLGLEPGIYHYDPKGHRVALVSDTPKRSKEQVNRDYRCHFQNTPALIVHMTMVKSRVIHTYGSLSHPLVFMEAGHRGQNILLASAAIGVGACPIGSGDYHKINRLLGVDGTNEYFAYGVAIGNKMS